MTCSRNFLKTKPKPIKKCHNMIFNFWKSNDFFQKPKVIRYSLFIFIFHICANFQIKKEEMCIWIFSITMSHFERITWILHMICAITIFGESSFIFNFVGYGLVIKSLGTRCTFEKVEKKTKHQKMNMNLFPTKLRWIISSNF
jgi:hypothetical protein